MQKLSIPFVLLLSLTFFSSRCQKTTSKKADSVKILDPEKIVFGDTTAKEFYDLGLSYYNQGDYKRALKAYKRVISLDSNYILAYFDQGVIYYDMGYYQKSIFYYKSAIKKILK